MSVDVEAILAQTPRWYRDFTPPFGLPPEELRLAVREVISSVVWRPGDRRALRLLAYAFYAEAISESEASARVDGSTEAFVADVRAEISEVHRASPEIDVLVHGALYDQLNGEQRASSADEGWALSILEFVAVAVPDAVPHLLIEEIGDFVAGWALQRWWSPSRLPTIVDAFMERKSPPTWDGAAAFLTEAGRSHVLRGDATPQPPGAGPTELRLAAMGVALTTLQQFRMTAKLDEAERTRSDDVIMAFTAELADNIDGRSSVARLRERVPGGRAASLLALLLQHVNGPGARHVASEADELLREYFRPIEHREAGRAAEALPYLARLVIDELVDIWVAIQAGTNVFDELCGKLRCDEYAYAFTYALYLTDRNRALALCAIAARAGSILHDQELIERARALAQMLSGLPAGVASPFRNEDRVRIEQESGVVLPADPSLPLM